VNVLVFFAIDDNKRLGPNVVFYNIFKNLWGSGPDSVGRGSFSNKNDEFKFVIVYRKGYIENEKKDFVDYFYVNFYDYFHFVIEVSKIYSLLRRKYKGWRIKFFYPKPMLLPFNVDQYAFLYDLPMEKIFLGKSINDLKKEFVFKKLVWKNMKKLFTISYSSFCDIKGITGLDNLDWFYLGVDRDVFRVIPDYKDYLRRIFEERGIFFNWDYFFAPVGKIWFRKNVLNLVKAFNNFRKHIRSNVKLVMTANNLNDKNEYIDSVKSNSNEDIVFLSGLNTEEMVYLYNGCLAVIFPSLYEGFGLPILEALACKKNVLFSDIKVFKEIYPDNKWIFNPLSVEDISNCLLNFYNEKGFLENRRILDKDIDKFSWRSVVENIIMKVKE